MQWPKLFKFFKQKCKNENDMAKLMVQKTLQKNISSWLKTAFYKQMK